MVQNSIDSIDTVSIPFGIVEYRYLFRYRWVSILGIVTGIVTKNAPPKKQNLNEKTRNGAETGECWRNPTILKKFEVQKLKYLEIADEVMDVKFVMGIFERISEYQCYRYFCKSIDTISIPIFVDTSHHYYENWKQLIIRIGFTTQIGC